MTAGEANQREDQREELVADLRQAAKPDSQYYLFICLSCVIATGGLIINSPAVVIGAMLVAPLVPPLLAVALASLGEYRPLLVRASVSLVTGAILAVLLSALLTWLAKVSPFDVLTSIPSEVESRTHPNPFDLGIAFAGGLAGSYAIGRLPVATTIAGVAIATALMPPLCTVGIGIVLGEHYIWNGAVLLFLANLVAIIAAATLVFALRGFHPRRSVLSLIEISLAGFSLVLITLLLAAATARSVESSRDADTIRTTTAAAVRARLPKAQLVDVTQTTSHGTLDLQVTIRVPGSLSVEDALAIQADVAQRLNRKTAVTLIAVPIVILDPLTPPTRTPTNTPTPRATPVRGVTPAP